MKKGGLPEKKGQMWFETVEFWLLIFAIVLAFVGYGILSGRMSAWLEAVGNWVRFGR